MAKVICPVCGVGLKIGDGELGKTVRCPACGAGFRARATAEAAPGSPSRHAPPQPSPGGSSVPRQTGPIEMADEPGPQQGKCPSCGAACPEGAVLCVNCGYDFRTGGKLSTQVEALNPRAARAAQEAARRVAEGQEAARRSAGDTRWAIALSILAFGAPLLLLAGLRFRDWKGFGDYAGLAGLPCGFAGLYFWVRQSRHLHGTVTLAGSMLVLTAALLICTALPTPVSSQAESGVPPPLPPDRLARAASLHGDALKAELDADKEHVRSLKSKLKETREQARAQEKKVEDARRVLAFATMNRADALANYNTQLEIANKLKERAKNLVSEIHAESPGVNDLIVRYNLESLSSRTATTAPAGAVRTLAEARFKFATKLSTFDEEDEPVLPGFPVRLGRRPKLSPPDEGDEPGGPPPEDVMKAIPYWSDVGQMTAYVTPSPGDGKRHPAILWLGGGFGNGVGEVVWKGAPGSSDRSASAFRQAGLVMMYPVLRGGNWSPGVREFFGEVDDVQGAARILATLEYVDPNRIYLGGHDTGGTLALLAAECSTYFRAVFAFGPVVEPGAYGLDRCPFDVFDDVERDLRSPGLWMDSIRCPTFVFEGDREPGNLPALRALQKACRNPLVSFRPVAGMGHNSVVAPVTALIARKILSDTEPACHISIDANEVPSTGPADAGTGVRPGGE